MNELMNVIIVGNVFVVVAVVAVVAEVAEVAVSVVLFFFFSAFFLCSCPESGLYFSAELVIAKTTEEYFTSWYL